MMMSATHEASQQRNQALSEREERRLVVIHGGSLSMKDGWALAGDLRAGGCWGLGAPFSASSAPFEALLSLAASGWAGVDMVVRGKTERAAAWLWVWPVRFEIIPTVVEPRGPPAHGGGS